MKQAQRILLTLFTLFTGIILARTLDCPPRTPKKLIEDSAVVAVGRTTAVEKIGPRRQHRYSQGVWVQPTLFHFEITRMWKGPKDNRVTLFSLVGMEYEKEFAVGEEYLIVAEYFSLEATYGPSLRRGKYAMRGDACEGGRTGDPKVQKRLIELSEHLGEGSKPEN